jgi:hypothetical protein
MSFLIRILKNVNNYANKNGIVKVFLGEVFNKIPVNLHFLKELKFVIIISKKIRVLLTFIDQKNLMILKI